MTTRNTWMLGLAALGLALAAPAQANPDGLDGSFMVAARDTRDDARQEPRTENKDTRNSKRDTRRDEPSSYGYGYERRQQQDQPDNKGNAPRQPRH